MQLHIPENNTTNSLSMSPSEERVLTLKCFHCSFHVAADLMKAVYKEELAGKGGRKSSCLVCRLLTGLLGKEKGLTAWCFSPSLPNNFTLRVLIFEPLLQILSINVPKSVTGNFGSRCFGILNDGSVQQCKDLGN